jgi:quercetin dioxygenase-like cupin family protein
MALHHASSGEIIQLRTLREKLPETPSTALLKSHQLEVMRLIIPAHTSRPEHHVAGELTMHCLEGAVEVRAHGRTQTLYASDMLFLEGGVPYSLYGVEHASLLMTVVLFPDGDGVSNAGQLEHAPVND